MSSLISINGRLTADPELRFTPSGLAVANFNVAVNRRTFDRATNEWKESGVDFYPCVVWRGYAENVAESLAKGDHVIVVGNMESRTYEANDGTPRVAWEIMVDEVGPALRFAVVKGIEKIAGATVNAKPEPTPTAKPRATRTRS